MFTYAGIDPPVNSPSVKGDFKEAEWDLSRYLCELEDNLRDVLSEVLETEMKAAYDELWQEVHFLNITKESLLLPFLRVWHSYTINISACMIALH